MKPIHAHAIRLTRSMTAQGLLTTLLVLGVVTSGCDEALTAAEDTSGVAAHATAVSDPFGASKDSALLAERISSYDASDYITANDIKQADGGYRLYVEGIGDVLVKDIRAPEGSTKTCRVDRRSLTEIAQRVLPGVQEAKWLRMNLFTVPEELGGGYFCLGLGVGCYILIAAHQPD